MVVDKGHKAIRQVVFLVFGCHKTQDFRKTAEKGVVFIPETSHFLQKWVLWTSSSPKSGPGVETRQRSENL